MIASNTGTAALKLPGGAGAVTRSSHLVQLALLAALGAGLLFGLGQAFFATQASADPEPVAVIGD